MSNSGNKLAKSTDAWRNNWQTMLIKQTGQDADSRSSRLWKMLRGSHDTELPSRNSGAMEGTREACHSKACGQLSEASQ